jgi:hypothetical protein
VVEAATAEVEEREAAWVEGTAQVGTEAVLGVTARAVREAEKVEREVGWVREAAREEAAVGREATEAVAAGWVEEEEWEGEGVERQGWEEAGWGCEASGEAVRGVCRAPRRLRDPPYSCRQTPPHARHASPSTRQSLRLKGELGVLPSGAKGYTRVTLQASTLVTPLTSPLPPLSCPGLTEGFARTCDFVSSLGGDGPTRRGRRRRSWWW